VYTLSLLEAMSRQRHGHQITLLLDRSLPALPAAPGNFDTQYLGCPGGAVLWEQVCLPLAARKFDLLHAPANGGPVATACPVVLTLHDVIFMRRWRDISAVAYPRQVAGHLYRTWVHPAAARRAREVLTVSEASKQDIQEILGLSPDRITVTHEALPESFRRCEPVSQDKVRSTFGLQEPYLMAMGAYEKRKNIPLLFRVMEWLSSNRKSCPQLVLAGAENLPATRYLSEVKQRQVESLVKFLPYVGEPELKGLYHGATAFLWPSRKEGFGLPLLEAMSCATPVIASDIPVHREVAGEAAIFVHPDDELGWHNAVIRVLEDDSLRRELRQKGLARVAEFSWDRTAEKTLAVYESVHVR